MISEVPSSKEIYNMLWNTILFPTCNWQDMVMKPGLESYPFIFIFWILFFFSEHLLTLADRSSWQDLFFPSFHLIASENQFPIFNLREPFICLENLSWSTGQSTALDRTSEGRRNRHSMVQIVRLKQTNKQNIKSNTKTTASSIVDFFWFGMFFDFVWFSPPPHPIPLSTSHHL